MTMMTPRLIVKDADAALRFYATVFEAETLDCFRDESRSLVVHAAMQLPGASILSLAEEDSAYGNLAPSTVGGSPVLFQLEVDDPDAVGARLVEAGGEELIPIEDRFYGHREGRFRDPFGHLWIISKVTEKLTPEEIRRRMQGG